MHVPLYNSKSPSDNLILLTIPHIWYKTGTGNYYYFNEFAVCYEFAYHQGRDITSLLFLSRALLCWLVFGRMRSIVMSWSIYITDQLLKPSLNCGAIPPCGSEVKGSNPAHCYVPAGFKYTMLCGVLTL